MLILVLDLNMASLLGFFILGAQVHIASGILFVRMHARICRVLLLGTFTFSNKSYGSILLFQHCANCKQCIYESVHFFYSALFKRKLLSLVLVLYGAI